jgi:hypothetical protein
LSSAGFAFSASAFCSRSAVASARVGFVFVRNFESSSLKSFLQQIVEAVWHVFLRRRRAM